MEAWKPCANGGWDIIGWYRRGEVTDASSTGVDGDDEIASLNRPIHIAYLFPANIANVKDDLEQKRFGVPEVGDQQDGPGASTSTSVSGYGRQSHSTVQSSLNQSTSHR